MIGDVNLFLKGTRADPDFEVEVEIMIAGASDIQIHRPGGTRLTSHAVRRPNLAEPAFRRKGLALTALQLLLSYATSPDAPAPLPVPRERLVVRIGEKNTPSIRLFEKLGFAITKRVAVFEEIEMRFQPQNSPGTWKVGQVRPYDSP